jgi:hypothetical protein
METLFMTDEGFLNYLDEQFLDKTSIRLHDALTTYYKDQRVNKPRIDDLIGLINSTKKYIVEKGEVYGNLLIRKNPDYIEPTERDKEISELTYKKLNLDVKNAKRVYDTYWITFCIAVAAFVISCILLVLKLRE